jgi:biopolymer transport protein ExbB
VAALMKAGILKVGGRREEVEKTLENAAIHEIARLERGLPVLATISNIAPIIGFLGTVVGMILAFADIERLAKMEPKEVAKGVKVALITTAGGLLVAVFTLPFYNFYTSRVSGFVRQMETSANILIETMDEMDALKA